MSNEPTDAPVARRWHIAGMLLLTALGIYAVAVALKLGLWRQNSPGDGRLPVIAAWSMTAFTVIVLVSAISMEDRPITEGAADSGAKLNHAAAHLLSLVYYSVALDPLGFEASTT